MIDSVSLEFTLDLDYSQLEPDTRMKAAFKASLDRNNPTIMGDEWRAIDSHSAVAYILSPPIKKAESESISAMALLLVAELLNSGGVAAKSESAGLAHGRERWLELALQYRKAIKDGDAHAASAALYRAWVQRAIHDEDTSSLYSVGMHLLGHRDVEVDDDLKVTDAVKWIDLMGLYLVADNERVKDFDLAIADRDASLNSTIAIDMPKTIFSSIPMATSGFSKTNRWNDGS